MTVEALITIHDQDLLLEREEEGRFAGLSRTWLFVGRRPVDWVPHNVKLHVSRDWSPNYERYPAFYDFTGWWTASFPTVIRAEHVICLQDDMTVLDERLADRCAALLGAAPGPVAFTAGHYSARNWMLMINGFAEAFNAGMAAVGVDVGAFPAFEEWPTTQGTAWRTEDLRAFMAWFEPLFTVWADDVWAGHLAERSMWAWMMSRGCPARFLPNVISHEARDLHGTGALMAGMADVHAARAATFGR